MRRVASTLGVFLASAVLSFCAVMMFGWPADTWADDAEPAPVAAGTTKIGPLLAASRLVQDDRVKGKWYIELSVSNTTGERAETADLEACLERQVFNPMARGPAPASIVWSDRQAVTVPAGQTIVVRRAIPAALAAQVTKARASQAAPSKGNGMPAAVTSFTTVVRRAGADQG